MEWYFALALLIFMVIGFMFFAVPVAFAFMVTNIVGALIFIGGPGSLLQVVDNSTSLITRFQLAPVPFFIFMGSLFFYSGLAIRVFDTLDKFFGRIPGRLCYLTVAGGTIFSTLTGSSMANTAMLGSLMVPEMQRRGYHWRMSLGPILGTGGLAMIIPPSTLGVLLASLAGIDVGRFLIAGIIPGLLLAVFFTILITVQIRWNPALTPRYDVEEVPWREGFRLALINITPMALVVFMVIGLIIFGIATPTESAAFGVVGVLILTFAFRLFSIEVLKTSMLSTIKVSGMVFFIILNSSIFSQLLAYSGASSGMLAFATSFDVSHRGRPGADLRVAADPRHVHGPGVHHADHHPDLLPADRGARHQPAVVRHPDADRAGDEPDDAPVRAAAVRDAGGWRLRAPPCGRWRSPRPPSSAATWF